MAEAGSSIRNALSELARRIGLQHPTETARVFSAWPQMVGDDIAAKCEPESLRGGVLRVRTDSAAWAGQLKYLGHEMVRRINQELGAEVITEVRAFVGPRTGGSKRSTRTGSETGSDEAGAAENTPKKKAPRASADVGSSAALEGVSEIVDDRLREATKRAHLAAKMKKNRG